MKFLLLTVLINISTLGCAFGDNANNDPVSLYNQGKFEQSLKILVDRGLKTGADFYNAGNCYYKLGRFGQALSHFKKAKRLMPGNTDIDHNLKLSLDQLNKTGSLPKDGSIWTNYGVAVTDQMPWSLIFLLFAGSTLLFCLLFQRNLQRPLTVTTYIIVLSCLSTVYLIKKTSIGSVISDIMVVRSGPSDTFTELFKLPAGTSVVLKGQKRDGWLQVQFSSNQIGWAQEKDLLKL